MRRMRLLTLVLGVAGLVFGVISGLLVSDLSAGRVRDVDADLQQHATATQDYFEHAASVTALTANSPAFSSIYGNVPVGTRLTAGQLSTGDAGRANAALAYLEKLYPGMVDEACFIDLSGAELARVVTNLIAVNSRLSPDESGNAFFAPTVALPEGGVYQARPYVSPDTNNWVISNSTQVRDLVGRPRGIVHFEIALESLRRSLIHADKRGTVEVIDAYTGAVIVDAEHQISAFTALSGARKYDVTAWGAQGHLELADRTASYQRLAIGSHNQNSWYVVVSAPALPRGWRSAQDLGPVSILLVSVLLLLASVVGYRQHSRQLQQLALHDELTGLGNGQALRERLERSLGGRNDIAALLLFDLDRFKHVNDNLGHSVGDALLMQVAKRLSSAQRTGELMVRFGGDEFGLLLPAPASMDSAVRRARELATVIGEPMTVDDEAIQMSASAGVVMVGEHGDDVATLRRRADLAMYSAKQRRTVVAVFSEALEKRSAATMSLESSLLRALDAGEFVLYYQPQIDLRTGEVRGVEALVRWLHPQRGLLSPAHFVPAAEECGLIVALTRYVLRHALDQAFVWHAQGHHVPIAVNLAARDLADSQLPGLIATLLAERGVPAELLHVELTETGLFDDAEQAASVLQRIQEQGILLAVDDFGTGFASIDRLRRLPFSELKIDQSFVAGVNDDPAGAHIVGSMVGLAHGLGMSVVAEGVETLDCLRVIQQIGCDVAQGYYFTRPLPPTEALNWILRHDPLSVAQLAALPMLGAEPAR